MLDAMHAFLALGWTGLAIFAGVMLLQIYYHIHDEILALGGMFGVVLYFALWMKYHMSSRNPYVEANAYTELDYRGRHRSENIVGEVRGMYYTWKLKKSEDSDCLFSTWVTEKQHEPTPIF